MKTPHAEFKGVKIIRVKGGFQIIGRKKVWRDLVKLTDSLK